MAMTMTASIPSYPNRAARKAARRQRRQDQPPRGTRPAPLIVSPDAASHLAAQRARQDHYRRLWRRQLDALLSPDDDAYAVMRTVHLASDHGTARATVVSAIAPALLAYLERRQAQTPPPPPLDARIRAALGEHGRDPYALAAARLALAQDLPEHSLVLELTGWQLISEYDLARAFDEGGRGGWSRPSVHNRKWAAVTWVREWLARG